uniref:Putative secreted protein n=1 Tax=Ixodes ricinus TaxID=34613 RepID=A0A6B0UNW9_IXORI
MPREVVPLGVVGGWLLGGALTDDPGLQKVSECVFSASWDNTLIRGATQLLGIMVPTMRRESSVLSRTTCSLEELWCPCTELSTLSTLAQTASTDPLSTWYVRRRSPTSHVRPMVFLRQLLYQ